MKEERVRRVIAQYLGDNTESVDIPWMEYGQRMGPKAPSKEQNSPFAYKNTDKDKNDGKLPVRDNPGGDGDIGPSLMDGVNDGWSMNKVQDTPPANENDSYRSDGDASRYPIEMNKFDRETTPESSLKWWWAEKHRQDEATGTPWGSNLYGEGVNVSNREASVKVASKNISQILESSTHPKTQLVKENAKSIKPTKVTDDAQEKKGLYTFKVGDENNTVKIQFLKANGETKSLLDHPCQLACDCESFLYWGPQFYAVEGNYMYMPMFRPQIIPPSSTSQGGRGRGLKFCKHIYAVASNITNLGIGDNYTDDIKEKLEDITDNVEHSPEGTKEVLDKFRVNLKTRFIQFLEDPKIHGPVYAEAMQQLKSKNIQEHQLTDYVNGSFKDLDKAGQEDAMQRLAKSPDMMVLLLLEYKKAFGTIPTNLVDLTYKVIKNKT